MLDPYYAFVIALKEEFSTIASALNVSYSKHRVGTELVYAFDLPSISERRRSCVAVLVDDMGNTESATVTANLLSHYSPTVIVSIGISGSLSSDATLCDLAVSTEVDEYVQRGKAVPSEASGSFKIEVGGKSRECTQALVKRISSFQLESPIEFQRWAAAARAQANRLLGKDDFAKLGYGGLIRQVPNINAGPTASGPYVSASADFAHWLKEHNRNFLAVDMEAAGVLSAASQHPDIYRVVIRGVSDFGDERKAQLDNTYRGAIRKCAVHNAISLVKHFIANGLFDIVRPDPEPSRTGGTTESPDAAAVLHEVSKKYWSQHHQPVGRDTDRTSRLYSYITTYSNQEPFVDSRNLFADLAGFITKSDHKYPIQLRGAAGAGKTAFLTALYGALEHKVASDANSPAPIFVDLKYYDEMLQQFPEPKTAVIALMNDLEPLRVFCEAFPHRQTVIIIDSVDYHAGHRSVLETELVRVLQRLPGTKKIVGVGATLVERVARHLPPSFNDPQIVIQLLPLPVSSKHYADFLDSFFDNQGADVGSRHTVKRWISLFAMEEVDILILSMFLRKASSFAYNSVETLSGFLDLYCRDALRDNIGPDLQDLSLADVSRCAHRHFILREKWELEGVASSVAWQLLHYHQIVRDFLIANHVIETLKAVGQGSPSNVADLNFVYPQSVDRLCKEIMNRDSATELACLDGAEQIVLRAKAKQARLQNAQTQVAYLAGRMQSAEAKERAMAFLLKRREECDRIMTMRDITSPSTVAGKATLLYARTVYISLAYLGHGDASRDYIETLMSDGQWDNLNRGFHLEYYKDIPYVPDSQQMAHVDELNAFPNTFRALTERLRKAVHSGSRGLLEVELYTLLSLAQHRHAKGRLDSDVRLEIMGLILECKPYVRQHLLRDFVDMIERNLSEPSYSVGLIAETLYKLKRERRKGYVKCELIDPESVADHTFGAVLLAKIYLPEKAPSTSAAWRGYEKDIVIETLLIHDLAEAFTGDRLPQEKDEQFREIERKWMAYLQMLNTYDGVHGLGSVNSMWEAFENLSDINARIANDIDKLENLMQLYIYRKEGQTISGIEEWTKGLTTHIETDAGQAILEVIQAHFRR
jgi:nucleoside phosphorylase/5'-deoxynucleotidase YfbR-like HD superfamily hydrolase